MCGKHPACTWAPRGSCCRGGARGLAVITAGPGRLSQRSGALQVLASGKRDNGQDALSVARVAGLDLPEQSRVSPTSALRASVDDNEHIPPKVPST